MVFFNFFFFFLVAKSISEEYCSFCYQRKQNYRTRHSNQAFNARQIEISVEPVSLAKGCRFTYQSRYSLKVCSNLTTTLTVISNTCCLVNTFERNQITQNNDFLNCILFWKWGKNDYLMLKQMKNSLWMTSEFQKNIYINIYINTKYHSKT